ncbi:hypothetical protein H2199_008787 [Coniosporium tulheliwenetii]|uniref:Uncharacterized protein n=1 Tax=Coniosporium tulheliwenetii TaxID=3383036 RepID=A0ACC2YHW1_9PEZI|nr:hypothetical protein H2199_008787 [Cladosporium sp. JES 115]
MKFVTATVAAAALSVASAAPTYPAGSSSNILNPTTLSHYSTWGGAVDYAVSWGAVLKPNGKYTDTTTLVTFRVPASTQGKTCEFGFYLDDSATLGGSKQFDVFTSLAPATVDTTTWPSGNLRDQHAGRMTAVKPGYATWVDGIGPASKTFPCPYGQTLAGELVGVNDIDEITWNGASLEPPLIKSNLFKSCFQYLGYPEEISKGEHPAIQNNAAISAKGDYTLNGNQGCALEAFNDLTPGQSGGPVWGFWPNEPGSSAVGVGSIIGSTNVAHPGSTRDDNDYGGGPALLKLVNWARANRA